MVLTANKVIFIRTRKPIDPVDLVLRICRDTQKTGTKRSRYAQRLTPVSLTGVATLEGFTKLAETLLNPIFHSGSPNQPAYKVRSLDYPFFFSFFFMVKVF